MCVVCITMNRLGHQNYIHENNERKKLLVQLVKKLYSWAQKKAVGGVKDKVMSMEV